MDPIHSDSTPQELERKDNDDDLPLKKQEGEEKHYDISQADQDLTTIPEELTHQKLDGKVKKKKKYQLVGEEELHQLWKEQKPKKQKLEQEKGETSEVDPSLGYGDRDEKGFDFEHSDTRSIGGILVLDLDESRDTSTFYECDISVQNVIKYYNEKKGANLELVKITKVNYTYGYMFYVTLDAKNKDTGEVRAYHCLVYRNPLQYKTIILQFKLKPQVKEDLSASTQV